VVVLGRATVPSSVVSHHSVLCSDMRAAPMARTLLPLTRTGGAWNRRCD
jgi:hypothetical protein